MTRPGHQSGFSLLIALILLSLSLMVAIQAFKVVFYQTRISIDHEGKTQAMLAAEAGALRAYTLLSLAPDDRLLKAGQRWEGDEMAGHIEGVDHRVVSLTDTSVSGDGAAHGTTAEYWIDSIARASDSGGDLVTIKSVGRGVDDTLSGVTLVARVTPGGKGVFDALIQSKGNISLTGSGRIDSYDSRKGAYGGDNVRSGAAVLAEGAGSVVTLEGGSPINGSVTTQGSVVLNGSAHVTGDINAGGDVDVAGGGSSVGGSINGGGNVVIESSGHIKGSVSTNGDVTIKGYGARIEGDINAGGAYNNTTGDNSAARGTITQHRGATVAVNTVATPDVALPSTMSSLDGLPDSGNMGIGPWLFNQVRITPDQVSHYDPQYNAQRWVNDDAFVLSRDIDVFQTKSSVLNLKNLSVSSDGHLFISGGDVVLYVDGDVSIGDSAMVTIARDATLTLLVTGRYSLSGSGAIEVESGRVIDTRGKPVFSIYSSYANRNGQAGIAIAGAASTYAVIYAPDTRVEVSGSGELYGALVAGDISVSGAGGVHYDEALKNAASGHGDNTAAGWSIAQLRYSTDQ